jgi:hypothetical protein
MGAWLLSACAGGHDSLATRQADFRNVENIISATSNQCRSAVAAMAGVIRATPSSSGTPAALAQAAQGTKSACSMSTDEEIQDLATLSVPGDLAGFRLDQASRDLTGWAADAVSVAKGLTEVPPNRTVTAALADLNAETSDMQRLAQSVHATLAAAAVALKAAALPLDIPSIGSPPG